jgi:hypothetical protein
MTMWNRGGRLCRVKNVSSRTQLRARTSGASSMSQQPRHHSQPAQYREELPVQPVDATPPWSLDLTTGFEEPIPRRRSSLLPKQEAFLGSYPRCEVSLLGGVSALIHPQSGLRSGDNNVRHPPRGRALFRSAWHRQKSPGSSHRASGHHAGVSGDLPRGPHPAGGNRRSGVLRKTPTKHMVDRGPSTFSKTAVVLAS